MNEIIIKDNKTLKLQNVVSVKLDLSLGDANLLDTEVSKMDTFIQTHGVKQIGPLIQFTNVEMNEENEIDIP